MAKSYIQLNDTIATFVDEHNSLVNKVGDLANLATTGDSDLIQAINEIHNSDSDNSSLIDSADTKLTTAWGLIDSADTKLTTAWGLIDSADTKLTTAWGLIDSADTKLTTAWGLIDSADTKLTTAWGLIDSADTKLSSVQLVADSAQSRIDGLITDRTAFPSNFIPDADGTRNLGADATRWNSTYQDYIRVTNNIHTGYGSAATPAFAFEGDPNTGVYRRAADELNISTGGSERLRISAEPRAETSGSAIDTSLTVWGTFDTLASEQFIAQSTGVLITGEVIFYSAGIAMYVYSRVKLIVTGGGDFSISGTQIDGISASVPFDYVSQSPSLSVTGLTPGGDYTVILEVAKGNAAACSAQGRVNYVHG